MLLSFQSIVHILLGIILRHFLSNFCFLHWDLREQWLVDLALRVGTTVWNTKFLCARNGRVFSTALLSRLFLSETKTDVVIGPTSATRKQPLPNWTKANTHRCSLGNFQSSPASRVERTRTKTVKGRVFWLSLKWTRTLKEIKCVLPLTVFTGRNDPLIAGNVAFQGKH